MNRDTSEFLDGLRALAALIVFFHHINWLHLDSGLLEIFSREVGHSAVVIFFVLSGFVIAASLQRTPDWRGYLVKRAARIYSVAVPAILLTIILDIFSAHQGYPPPAAYELNKPWLYLPLHLVFAGDLWWLGISAFSNNPWWSLNYEVWYYAAFGTAVFLKGWKRAAATLLVLALMGPKLLLLLPIWLTGVGIYALYRRGLVLARTPARMVASVAPLLYILVLSLHWDEPVAVWGAQFISALLPFPLRFSQWFAADWIIGVITGALVWALSSAEFRPWRPVAWASTRLAAVSFTLYLVHFPLLLFFGHMLPDYGPLAAALVLMICVGLGTVIEPQRERLRRILSFGIGLVAERISRKRRVKSQRTSRS